MRRGKLVVFAIMCLALVRMGTVPSLGWEFQMTGSMNWYYEFYNQMGSQGVFGPYNVDNGAGPATGNLNYWWGSLRLQGQNLVTGSDAT